MRIRGKAAVVAAQLAWFAVPAAAAEGGAPGSRHPPLEVVEVDALGRAVHASARPASALQDQRGDAPAEGGTRETVDAGRRCQDALARTQTKLLGNFAVLEESGSIGSPSSPEVMRSQVRALYDCGWLGRPAGDDLVATVASEEDGPRSSLARFTRRYRTLLIRVSPWPGNLVKLSGYGGLLRALVRVARERGRPTQLTRVLLTDCCDVLFRLDASCFGGGAGAAAKDVFSRFSEVFARRGQRVVLSAERSTSMLMSQEDYVAGLHRARATASEAKSPPLGWLVPVNRPLRGDDTKSVQRKRHFSHRAAELPPSPLLNGHGTPDVCTGVDGLCLHAKSANTGLILGELEPLADFFQETVSFCGEHCAFDAGRSTWQSSDQNPVGHYLLSSKFCGGRCTLDYNFTLFHTMQGRFGAYRVHRSRPRDSDREYASLSIRIPTLKAGSRPPLSEDVLATQQWIALSPEVFGEDWFPVPACALHASGLPEPHQAFNLRLLRERLRLPPVAMESSGGWTRSPRAGAAAAAGGPAASPPRAVPLMRHA